MKNLEISNDCTSIEAGAYGDASFSRCLLPAGLLEIQEGAFSPECTDNFWVVEGSYGAERIAQLCPKSKLTLFSDNETMLSAWENQAVLRRDWREVRRNLRESDLMHIMDLTGWTYKETVSRAEKAYRKDQVSAKEYGPCKWKKWYNLTPDKDPAGTWIEWRKDQVDKLERSLTEGGLEYDFDTSIQVPLRMSARKYAGIRTLGKQIRAKEITLEGLCDYLDVDVPEDLEEKKKSIVPNVAFYCGNVKPGGVLFCWRKAEVRPAAVKRAGALCVFGPRRYKEEFMNVGLDYIVCDHMQVHMTELTNLWRKQFPDTKTVVITGSVGKTTTTEMINHVALSTFKSNCIWVNKNLPHQCATHTQWLDEDTGVFVQEASGAGVGQLERLCSMIEPDIYVLTNVGSGHIGLHGGSRMSLLYEKTTPDRRASKNALGVVNYDDELLRKTRFYHEVAWFSMSNPEADYHGENIVEEDGLLRFDVVEKDGTRTPVVIHAIGLHNVYDALAAYAVGVRLGIDRKVIAEAIGMYRSAGVRQNLVEIAGRRVFLDCYSATEDSMRTALDTAQSFHVKEGGKRIVVLGDIPDLGSRSEEIHLNVGYAAKNAQHVDEVIFYGSMIAEAAKLAEGGKAAIRYTNSRKELESWLSATSKNDVVIFKASHKMELHRVADDWLGMTNNLDDLRESVLERPVCENVKYTNVDNYGACAVELVDVAKELKTVEVAGQLPVRLISSKAFENTIIEHAELLAPMISIGRDAFSNCQKLKTVKLPESLYYLGIGAFRDCAALEGIQIPKGCATIDSFAFAGCKSLKHVEVPASVLSMGENAFDPDCDAEFVCVKDSYGAQRIAQLCPNGNIILKEAQADDVCLPMPDMDVFIKEDKVYTADSNIDSIHDAIKPVKGSAEGESIACVTPVLTEIPEGAKVQTITISAVGDCTLGKNHLMSETNSWGSVFEAQGPAYFFSGVKSVFEASDIAIANLEGVLTDKPVRQIDFYRQRSERIDPKKYCHLGETRYLEAFVEGGVDVATFANNHNMDYGVAGYIDTIETCKRYNLPVAHYDHVVRKQVGDIQVGIVSVDFTYCTNKVGEGILMKAMADVRRDCQLIIVCIHWGQNYKEVAGKNQRRLGHLCVDLGADLVVGSHAHILQGVERYKGRYIFHSMGNFCYGGRAIPKDNDTMILQQAFTFVDGQLFVTDDVKLIPCWTSGTCEINDFRPVIKTGKAAAAIIEKVNSRSSEYGLSFDAEGRPVVEKATDLRARVLDQVYDEEIPDIIYTLTDVMK